jgi:hypothetical protein
MKVLAWNISVKNDNSNSVVEYLYVQNTDFVLLQNIIRSMEDKWMYETKLLTIFLLKILLIFKSLIVDKNYISNHFPLTLILDFNI